MDTWSWVCELLDSDKWLASSGSSLCLDLTTLIPTTTTNNNNSTPAIQLRAERTILSPSHGVDDDASLTISLHLHGFNTHSTVEEKALWTSEACLLSSDKPFLPLILQILQENISRAPRTTQNSTTCPRSQLQNLKPEPVSWILDSHSPESFSTFFDLIFLTRLFWLCVFDSPSEVGSFYFHSLLAPNLQIFSFKDSPVFRSFLASSGIDVELCLVRTFGYMLSKWLILREVSAGLLSLTPLPTEALDLSYARETHGLWVLKGYAPVKAMRLVHSSDHKNPRPIVETKESVLRYALAHQQLEAVFQLEYTVEFQDGHIRVKARVDNLRFHVATLGFGKNEDDSYAEERYFPSRIKVWVGPEVGATYVGGLTLGKSTDDVGKEMEMQRVVKGSFGKMKSPKMKATTRMATRCRMKNWRWDQDAQGNAAIFEAILSDNASGVELAAWKPGTRGCNVARGRYGGPDRPFMKNGGVVFAGCGQEDVEWRLSKEMEGSMLRWRMGAQVWLSYFPNDVRSSYFETRRVQWCDEVDLPLIP